MIPYAHLGIDMGDEGRFVHAGHVANGNQVRFSHHGVGAVGVEADAVPDTRPQGPEIPHKVLAALEEAHQRIPARADP